MVIITANFYQPSLGGVLGGAPFVQDFGWTSQVYLPSHATNFRQLQLQTAVTGNGFLPATFVAGFVEVNPALQPPNSPRFLSGSFDLDTASRYLYDQYEPLIFDVLDQCTPFGPGITRDAMKAGVQVFNASVETVGGSGSDRQIISQMNQPFIQAFPFQTNRDKSYSVGQNAAIWFFPFSWDARDPQFGVPIFNNTSIKVAYMNAQYTVV